MQSRVSENLHIYSEATANKLPTKNTKKLENKMQPHQQIQPRAATVQGYAKKALHQEGLTL